MEKSEPLTTKLPFRPLKVGGIVLLSSVTVVAGGVLLLGLALLTASYAPTARLEHRRDAVTVHVEFLGEYPTTVRRIRLMNATTRETLFEIAAAKGSPQIHSFPLVAGENRVDVLEPYSGTYAILTPQGKNTFDLERKTPYLLSVWGDLGIRRDTTIHF